MYSPEGRNAEEKRVLEGGSAVRVDSARPKVGRYLISPLEDGAAWGSLYCSVLTPRQAAVRTTRSPVLHYTVQYSIAADMSLPLNRKYKLSSSDQFDEYMKAMGESHFLPHILQ